MRRRQAAPTAAFGSAERVVMVPVNQALARLRSVSDAAWSTQVGSSTQTNMARALVPTDVVSR